MHASIVHASLLWLTPIDPTLPSPPLPSVFIDYAFLLFTLKHRGTFPADVVTRVMRSLSALYIVTPFLVCSLDKVGPLADDVGSTEARPRHKKGGFRAGDEKQRCIRQ